MSNTLRIPLLVLVAVAGAAAGGPQEGGAGASEAKRPKEDDVVDADFKEVKRDA